MLNELRQLLNEQLQRLFGIISSDGKIIMCSDNSKEGTDFAAFDKLIKTTKEKFAENGLVFAKIKAVKNTIYYIFIQQKGEDDYEILNLVSLYVKEYLKNNTEKTDIDFFLKQIIENDIDDANIKRRVKLFKINQTYKKIAIVIKTNEVAGLPAYEILKNMFHDSKDVYIVHLTDFETVICIPIKQKDDVQGEKPSYHSTLHSVIDTLEEQLLVPVKVGVGQYFYDISDLYKSYCSVHRAFDAMAFFREGYSIYDYNAMGVEKLFHATDRNELENFAQKTIPSEIYDKIDEETVKTMRVFFENNLNISETARKMYVHRNTLVYRIEKFNKLTGLDITKFENAVLFDTVCKIKYYLKNTEGSRND